MNVSILAEGRATGAGNMARDEALARALSSGEIGPTIRLYGWAPPSVSIGFHQEENDFDRAALARLGIDLVRRPTGGRAILHWHELTYCALLPLTAGSALDLCDAQRGAPRRNPLDGHRRGTRRPGGRAETACAAAAGIPCFTVSVKSEIGGGRKIVGSTHGATATSSSSTAPSCWARSTGDRPPRTDDRARRTMRSSRRSPPGPPMRKACWAGPSPSTRPARPSPRGSNDFSETPDLPDPSGTVPEFATSHR